jgi:hypothetical protein
MTNQERTYNFRNENHTRQLLSRYLRWWRWLWVVLAIVGIMGIGGSVEKASAISFGFDTSLLAGTSARLELNLLDGDFVFGNNSATAFGSTIFDPDQIIQDLVLGNSLLMDISFSTNFAGGDPDLLILNLLDPATNLTLVDTNLDALSAPVPYQDALFVIGLSNGTIQTAATTNPSVGVTVVPEPGTIVLLVLGLPVIFPRKIRPMA